MVTADDLLRWYARYGWTDTCHGEWGEIQRDQRGVLHEVLEEGRTDLLGPLMDSCFRTTLYWGLVSLPGTSPEELERSFPYAVWWRMAIWRHLMPPGDLEHLRATDAGNPLVLNVESVPVMVDTPRFDCYAATILHYVPPRGTVFEIGGGYGGVALQLWRRSMVSVVLCDIPESLYLAAWVLSRSGVDVGWWDEHPDAQVRLLPIQDRDQWEGVPDLVFAAHTFSGLPADVTREWMAWIDGSGARYLYHDDALHAPTEQGVWLTDKYPEVTIDTMPRPQRYREHWRRRIPWGGWNDRFSEVFWRRV